MDNMNAPVIVVTEEKKRRKGAILTAGIVAGAVALVGGGTFALWSASDNFGGGAITAGDLNIVTADETTVIDASPDRTDFGHPIELATWRAVPGDVVRFQTDATITLIGENLVANLGFDTPEGQVMIPEVAGARVEATIIAGTAEADLADGIYFTSVSGGALAAGDAIAGEVFPVGADGTLAVTVQVDVYFDTDTPDRDLVNQQLANLAGGRLVLNQVRDTGALFGTPAPVLP